MALVDNLLCECPVFALAVERELVDDALVRLVQSQPLHNGGNGAVAVLVYVLHVCKAYECQK